MPSYKYTTPVLVIVAVVGGYVIGVQRHTPTGQESVPENSVTNSGSHTQNDVASGSDEHFTPKHLTDSIHTTVQSPQEILIEPAVSGISQQATGVASPGNLTHTESVQALLLDYAEQPMSYELPGQIAEALLAQHHNIPTLLTDILLDETLSSDQKTQLLGRLYEVADQDLGQQIVDYALEQTMTGDPANLRQGLSLISSVDLSHDARVREQLLTIGLSSPSPEDQMSVAASLTNTLVPPAERQQIISYFSQLSHAEDPQLRSLALQRLGEWGQGDHFRIAASDALYDTNPMIRASAIRAMAPDRTLVQQNRQNLLSMVGDPEEDSMVRISAAESLFTLDLNEEEYRLVHAALQAEGIVATHDEGR